MLTKRKSLLIFKTNSLKTCWNHGVNILEYLSQILQVTDKFFKNWHMIRVLRSVEKELKIKDRKLLDEWMILRKIPMSN